MRYFFLLTKADHFIAAVTAFPVRDQLQEVRREGFRDCACQKFSTCWRCSDVTGSAASALRLPSGQAPSKTATDGPASS